MATAVHSPDQGRERVEAWLAAVDRRWPAGRVVARALAELADPSTLRLNYMDHDVHRRLVNRAHSVPGGLGRALNYLQQLGLVSRAKPALGQRRGRITLTLPASLALPSSPASPEVKP